jgi:hypothetical protein
VSRAIADGVKTDVKLEFAVLITSGPRSCVATLWLAIQCASFAVAPVLLADGHADATVTICTCPGDHRDEACPMHQAGGAAKDDTDECTMRSASTAAHAVLLSLTGGLGIPSTSVTLEQPVKSDRIASSFRAAIDRTRLPDSPPPRG